MEVFIFRLTDHIAAEIRLGDEQRVLQVHLILLVIVVVDELAVTRNGKLARLVVIVRDDRVPYFIRSVLRHIVGRLRGDLLILGRNDRVRGTVAALALVALKGLAHRCPRGRPVLSALRILDVNVAARLIKRHAVETIADDTSVRAGLHEAVSARVVRNDRAVLRGSQIVSPCRRGVGSGDDVLLCFLIKITVLHIRKPLQIFRIARQTADPLSVIIQYSVLRRQGLHRFKYRILHPTMDFPNSSPRGSACRTRRCPLRPATTPRCIPNARR